MTTLAEQMAKDAALIASLSPEVKRLLDRELAMVGRDREDTTGDRDYSAALPTDQSVRASVVEEAAKDIARAASRLRARGLHQLAEQRRYGSHPQPLQGGRAMSEERCETCRFWRDLHDGWAAKGDCLRFPPTLGTDGRYADRDFPKTVRTNWCGEYQPASPDTELDGRERA